MALTSRLTERITIEKQVVSATTFGGLIESWQDYRTVYATISNQKGNKFDSSTGPVYDDSISFYMRYIQLDGTKGFQIRYNNKYYEIINYTVIGRNKDLVIDCKAKF
jgi:SPP1 family predicted phage head-tail adaptor